MIEVVRADARSIPLADESVQCVVTSPPYWGLRDYGVDGQLGLERTPEEYVANMVSVFREVRRVLRKDGTVWLNLGDSYCATDKWGGGKNGNTGKQTVAADGSVPSWTAVRAKKDKIPGLKPKDLCGIPWRVAFALQADGWYLRQDCIWAKPNPMPESVTDRCTKSHEYVFLFAKGQWSTRTIKFSDLPGKVIKLNEHGCLQPADSRAGAFCIALASAVLQTPQSQRELCLAFLDAQKWKQGAERASGNPVAALPTPEGALRYAAGFLNGHFSPKEFIEKIDCCWADLRDGQPLIVGGIASENALSPSLYSDADATVTVKYAGEIGKFDFARHELIISRPVGCSYFYDAEAVKEPLAYAPHAPGNKKLDDSRNDHDEMTKVWGANGTRNLRSVWHIPTQPYKGAHFATFPEKLVEPCILAGTSERGTCSQCGAPWERMVERGLTAHDGGTESAYSEGTTANRLAMLRQAARERGEEYRNEARTIGWQPTCSCSATTKPCVVLDPFCGSGTVGVVCARFNREFIGLDINDKYLELARQRIGEIPLALPFHGEPQ